MDIVICASQTKLNITEVAMPAASAGPASTAAAAPADEEPAVSPLSVSPR